VTTRVAPSTVIFSREVMINEMIDSMAGLEGAGGIFLSARPMAAVTGEDYERACRQATARTGKPVMYLPPKSLQSDWLGGYEEVLLACAKGLDLAGAAPDPAKVALVGYLWDRNEGDHLGNVQELRRYLEALGLSLETVWLGGERLDDLGRVRDAGTIVSLPHGRAAARHLAERTGAKLVETCLPFGFEATQQFLREVGAATGRAPAAERLIDAELTRAVPLLEWVIPFVFQNSRLGFIGNPSHLRGFRDIAALVGAQVAFAFLTTGPDHPEVHGGHNGQPALAHLAYDPTQEDLLRFVPRQIEERGLDLIVTSNVGTPLGRTPIMEFGFPQYYTHTLVPRPFLGFMGCVAFVETMANTIRHARLH
ncbi:MAG TPA: nitrogenase component 1, partial [Polyangia bacterium]